MLHTTDNTARVLTAEPPRRDPDALIDEAVARACARVAPTWPLDRFIAVNPFWGFTELSPSAVSARLGALAGARLVMPRAWYREQWNAGRLQRAHLREALALTRSSRTAEQLIAALAHDPPAPARRALVTDVLDARRDPLREMPWREFVTHSVSQHCAAYFDDGQAQLGPARAGGLYASWRRRALEDRSPALLMGLGVYRTLARDLPPDARGAIATALSELAVAPDETESYLTALLLDINGWAAWCAYLRWTARLRGGDDDHFRELLAVRLAWELTLLRSGGAAVAARWHAAMAAWPAIDRAARTAHDDDWVLQRALELAYSRALCERLTTTGFDTAPVAAPAVQAVFCIDVRSEVFRRALEAQDATVQTMGFAGFFGLPAEYQPLGDDTARPQLPGLLAPRVRVSDAGVAPGLAAQRTRRLDLAARWARFKTGASSTFSFVESLGLLYGARLATDGARLTRPVPHPERAGLSAAESSARRPRLAAAAGGGALEPSARHDLAAGILRAMGLTRDFARLVALVGHGSQTVNNPHAAGLDCGACCGQTGEANARAVAALLNEPDVRAALRARGIDVPATTRFVAGLHDTTTDRVALFDLDEVPPTHAPDLARLRAWLDAAGDAARAERAARFELSRGRGAALRDALDARARDWSQVRPEWGLANNAALVLAPRERSRGLDLEGRAFLHDYRAERDPDFATLELLLTAPMVVAHWINLQYYASTVDNPRYGSGNKVLHNVVGGHLGVFEGNGGDLRVGLPLQSLHDGARWVHTPLRLSVFVEAPRAAIDAVLRKHAKVRELVDNEWLYLFQIDADARAIHARRGGAWAVVSATDRSDEVASETVVAPSPRRPSDKGEGR